MASNSSAQAFIILGGVKVTPPHAHCLGKTIYLPLHRPSPDSSSLVADWPWYGQQDVAGRHELAPDPGCRGRQQAAQAPLRRFPVCSGGDRRKDRGQPAPGTPLALTHSATALCLPTLVWSVGEAAFRQQTVVGVSKHCVRSPSQ